MSANHTTVLIDPNTYWYHNASMARNNGTVRYETGNYSTDVVANTALEFMDTAISADTPFFLGVTPIGPHAEMIPTSSGVFFLPSPAERHADLFPNISVPRTASFNELRVSSPGSCEYQVHH